MTIHLSGFYHLVDRVRTFGGSRSVFRFWAISIEAFVLYFLYSATLKSEGYYVIPSVKKIECPSETPVRTHPISFLEL